MAKHTSIPTIALLVFCLFTIPGVSAEGPSSGPASLDKAEIESTRETESTILTALRALDDHVKNAATLNENQIAEYKKVIDANKKIFGMNPTADLISAAFDLVTDYENTLGPLFIGVHTKDGFDRTKLKLDIHTTVYSVMQYIVDYVFTSETLSKHENLLRGFEFKSAAYFPGAVNPPADPDQTHTAKIDGSYLKTFGHMVMHGDRPARKPTGTYLAPGTIATVTVPKSIVGKGYGIRVGAHSWDLSRRRWIRRLERSTVVYGINSTETKIASPLGGGIYIEVPYLANAGIVDVQIRNAVRSPYFSAKSFDRTSLSDWQNIERKHQAPWADFQSEKVLIQVPTSWIYNFDDPLTMMKDWDSAMDAVSDLMGFPHIRGKEVLYLQPDVIIRSTAYSPGYPQVNAKYNPTQDYDGNRNHYFLTGPQHSPYYELHEMGHGQLFQKFSGEAEAAVNLLYVAVMNQKFGMSLDEAFRKSMGFTNEGRTLANTAKARMATENFKLEKPMSASEMRYQLKGYAKYVEIAHLFGWEVLNKYWRSINEDHEVGIEVKGGLNNGDTDSLILRMSKAAGVDVTPLIHFWGRHPNDVAAVKAAIAAEKLPASTKIYDLLVQYKAAIPADNQAFREFAQKWWGRKPRPKGYDTERFHAALWDSWDQAYARDIKSNLQNIIDLYFPNGRP